MHLRRRSGLMTVRGFVIGAVVAISSCSSDQPTQATYCQLAVANAAILSSPAIFNDADIVATLTLYGHLANAAPLTIAAEWQTLVDTMQTANTVDTADPASLQRATDAARLSTPAANRIVKKTEELCGITLGGAGEPTTTTLPSEQATTTTTV